MQFSEPKRSVAWIIVDPLLKDGVSEIEQHLKAQGFDVQIHNLHQNALEAVNAKATQLPAMILCDSDAGKGITGEDFLKELKQKTRWQNVPVAAFSNIDAVNEKLVKAGADTFFNRDALAIKLNGDAGKNIALDPKRDAAWMDRAKELRNFDAFVDKIKAEITLCR